jgi:AmmeMemoRadiSam system protein B
MENIETLNHGDFAQYLSETDNTICGRHPIGVLLAALAKLRQTNQQKQQLKFVHYDQSSPCKTPKDSSVSYASAYVLFE